MRNKDVEDACDVRETQGFYHFYFIPFTCYIFLI